MTSKHNFRWMLISGVLLALLSVIIGAFAAHGLKTVLSEYALALFETGARYQMYHGLALILCSLFCVNLEQSKVLSIDWLKRSATFFLVGSIIFCGSLYLLGLTDLKWLGAITPIGGLCFILGWLSLLLASFKAEQTDEK